ncbi:MAG: hypothetical protein B6D44_09765 [Ignavibacteriales bacterium UTCHB2]|jgi:hypothetical protein|nr:MAG: hypothetical protein B6D44_09765 [Ignavibacteriales bacterium UTCHB2]HQI42300.1 T9SS type A sorting domain-containing protein [Ignavibacteriaceae bacterium]
MRKYFIQIMFLVLLLNSLSFSQWSTNPNNNLIIGYGQDPHIRSDSAGGCYITYNNNISYPRKLILERINKYGYKPWETMKQIQGELPQQWQAEIIEDGEGGVIVSYEDWYQNLPNLTTRVRVQRVDSSGNFLWGQTGVRVSVVDTNQGAQRLISDGNGGCIITWVTSDSISFNQYWINRIDRTGQRVWSDSGLYIMSDYNYDSPSLVRASDGNYYVQIRRNLYRIREDGEIIRRDSVTLGSPIPDPQGGIILSGGVGSINNGRFVTQRQDSLGNNLWQEPYIEVADSLYYLNPSLSVKQNNGYFYYCWTGKRNGIDRVTQFQVLRLDGSKLFPNGSLTIGKPPSGGAVVLPLEPNKTALIYSDSPDSLLVQTYDTLGNKLWNEEGILISYSSMGSQSYTTDGNGGFIIVGTIEQFTIVAQQVNKYGQLGEVIIPVELISFNGKLLNNSIELSWQTATEINNMGFEIERASLSASPSQEDWEKIGFVQGFGTTTEPRLYSFIDEDVNSGVYKYRLRQVDYDGTFTYSDEVEVAVDFIPKEYVLFQNYPNPFNSSTIIKYQIPKDERVRINLYNILGEKILTLIETEQKAGEHEIRLSSDELASGNYFYSLETNATRLIKKLLILK